jgi:hypothetical protein
MGKSARTPARLARPDFDGLVSAASGLEVAHTWLGYGSAIFLELGALRHIKGANNPRGEFSVMIEWSWRVESQRRVEFGSWSGDRKIASGVASLKGHTVEALALAGRLPELVVALGGGRWVHSFMTAEGQPRWVVFLPGGDWVRVRRGVLVREARQ